MIVLDFNNMMSTKIGKKDGVSEEELAKLSDKIKKYGKELKKERKAGKLAFAELPSQNDVAINIKRYADENRDKFDDFVVLGIGGSALGNIAVHTALNHPAHNRLSGAIRRAPRIHVVDNIDPERFRAVLDTIDPKKTLFNVISKSGSTAETMAQFMIVRELLHEQLGKEFVDHIVITTDEEKGTLRKIVEQDGHASFAIPDGVGGRFSVLSPVGLLSAAMSGVDVVEMLSGAATMDERNSSDDVWTNPAFMAAALQFILDTKKGKNIAVMMAYSNALKDVADWFRQLWAESLGKKHSLGGKVVYRGQTPVKAVGATDQHSQLQLYTEGPNDKTFTFLSVQKFRQVVDIPKSFEDKPEVAYLGAHTLNRLLQAEKMGTEIALTDAKRPNCTIVLSEISPFVLGELFYMLEMQTVMAGKLYQVNAFDQPGVESSKEAAYALMGRKGYEKKRAEIEAKTKKDNKYIIR